MRSLLISFLFTLIVSAVAATPAQPVAMPQSSFENIKVLTGMSDTDIRNEMNDWTEALGVTCNYCHVAGDFPSDMNPKKETARKMATMVKLINKDFLGGKAKCILCHRGAAVPNP
jgi:photosynthetic reaction center cytochrome c subunit